MKRIQIAPYKKNGAMQLIVATGTGFIIFHFTKINNEVDINKKSPNYFGDLIYF
jgi:hypothetical protein